MNQDKLSQTRQLTLSALLLAIALVAQIIGRNFPDFSRLFVGPIVNAVLFIAAALCPLIYAVIIGCLTPVLALVIGQLKAPLAPMIPFIIVSNIILVLIFSRAEDKLVSRGIWAVIASVAKYLFFLLTTNVLLSSFGISFPEKIMQKLPVAFGTTQLIAALIGAVIAILCLERIPFHKLGKE